MPVAKLSLVKINWVLETSVRAREPGRNHLDFILLLPGKTLSVLELVGCTGGGLREEHKYEKLAAFIPRRCSKKENIKIFALSQLAIRKIY